jgi:heptosyltransferase III
VLPVLHRIKRRILACGQQWLAYPRRAKPWMEPYFMLKGFRRAAKSLPEAGSILVVKLDRLGDVVLASGFLRGLRASAPQAEITLVVRSGLVELVERCPYVDAVCGFECDERWIGQLHGRGTAWLYAEHRRMLRFAAEHLWPRRPDLALVPRYDCDHCGALMLAYLSGATRRVSFSPANWTSGYAAALEKLLTGRVDCAPELHEVTKLMTLLRSIGGAAEHERLELWFSEEDRNEGARLAGFDRDDGRVYVSLGVGASDPAKQWPMACFLDVARSLLTKPDLVVLVVGDRRDGGVGREIRRVLGDRVVDLCGKTTLRQLAALLERCALHIGNDSGPLHMAAATPLPVVEISAHARSGAPSHPLSPSRFGPWATPCVVLQPPAGCGMEGISVRMVQDAVRKLMPAWRL